MGRTKAIIRKGKKRKKEEKKIRRKKTKKIDIEQNQRPYEKPRRKLFLV